MTAYLTTTNIALGLMALAIIAAGYAPVAPDEVAGTLKATAGIATGLAGLFLHPPTSSAAPPPAPSEGKAP